MRVGVLGSGSQGNSIAIQGQNAALLLDCGFGPRSLQRRAKESGLDLESVAAILLTHEHGDHIRGVSRIAKLLDCPVYASTGTLAAISHDLDGVDTVTLGSHQPVRIASFTVTACRTNHDAAEPLALRVEDTASRTAIGVAYDVGRSSAGIRHLLRRCNCLIVEANHDDVMLRTGPYPPSIRQRISGSAGHLSNRAAGELLADLAHGTLSTVVLAHLSDKCNTPDVATRTVSQALEHRNFKGEILVARQRHALPAFTVLGAGGQQELPGLD